MTVILDESMTEEVLVTRKGQTIIPASLRRKYKISEGTKLKVQDTGSGILFRKVPSSTLELIGSGAKHATVEHMKKRLDEIRAAEENE
jgi:AbrB family looped-hinge helix DNA binding protein